MTKEMIPFLLLGFGSVLISAVSQVLLKKAAQRPHTSIIAEYTDPCILFAYFLFFGSTVLTMLAYKGVPLSMGPMFEGSSYIYITVFGAVFFKERINVKKLIALILILCGIAFYAIQ